MNTKTWVKRLLHGVLLIGTAIAAAMWIATMTAKCEGFGCLGLLVFIGIAVIAHIVSAIAGGVLIRMRQLEDKAPKWLILLEALHLLPVLWFVVRMALS